jgi:hypothetical protein
MNRHCGPAFAKALTPARASQSAGANREIAMMRNMKLGLIGIAAFPLLAALGCSMGGGYHDGYYSRGHDYDHARSAGYYEDHNTRAADRSTGMTPSQYRANTYYNGGENGLAPENWGTTHSDRVQKSQERQSGY